MEDMKIKVLMVLFLLFTYKYSVSQIDISQIIIDQDANVQQVTNIITSDIIGFQSLNNDAENINWSKQTGNNNKISISQQKDQWLGKNNQSYTFQNGDGNEIILDQTGNGNLFLSLQLGYLTINSGNRNRIDAVQEGNSNELVALQSGEDNSISADQRGMNNHLLILQKGNNNSVTNYPQENISGNILFDSIIQNGDNLSLITNNTPRTTANRNTFIQTGTNLSLSLENQFINSMGGMEINQTGHDMKIIVNQSYFPTQ
jgi:hypothetical protein